MFQGAMVALVTPMHPDGSIDKKSLDDLIEWHIESKTTALIVTGTTGESATLTVEEQQDVLSFTLKQVAKRIPVIAGTGSNATHHALELTKKAKQLGADAALIVTPYYNKPTQEGLFEHYKLIASQVALPIILYNVPGRTACDLLPETVSRLAKIKNIIGIKEATGKIDRAVEIQNQCGESFEIYSGDDATALDLIKIGAKGVISVTGNVAPRDMHDMCKAFLSGDEKEAETINAKLMLLHQKLFLEANPIPVKWALHNMKRISSGIRLPLTWLSEKFHPEVQLAMQSAGVL